MRRFEEQEFTQFYDDNSGATFADLEFIKCSFRSSVLSLAREPSLRSTYRNIRLVKCEQRGCTIDAAIVEDAVIENFRTHTLLQTWGAVFKHVKFRGRIGRIMISAVIETGMAPRDRQRAFDEANAEYYQNVDWALDLREAEFEECDLRGVPATLVRRDPETQIVITREKAIEGGWRNINFGPAAWGTAISLFLERGDPDLVLVAPKRHRKFSAMFDGLKRLRDAGIAEPG